MAIEIREPVPTTVRPVALPRRTRPADLTAWLVVSVLLGIAAGAMIHSLVTAEDRAASATQIRATRAAATV